MAFIVSIHNPIALVRAEKFTVYLVINARDPICGKCQGTGYGIFSHMLHKAVKFCTSDNNINGILSHFS